MKKETIKFLPDQIKMVGATKLSFKGERKSFIATGDTRLLVRYDLLVSGTRETEFVSELAVNGSVIRRTVTALNSLISQGYNIIVACSAYVELKAGEHLKLKVSRKKGISITKKAIIIAGIPNTGGNHEN